MRYLFISLTCLCGACGGGGATPAPTPLTQTPVTPPITMVRGLITETQTGAPVGSFSSETTTFPARVTVSAPGYVTREAVVGNATPTVDLIREDGRFSLELYRQMVRNTYDAPAAMEPLRRQIQAPRIYLRTVDEAGLAMPRAALDAVVNVLADENFRVWTGGRFGIAGLELGTETREGQTGWITVKWPNPMTVGICGRAQVAGTWIELNYLNSSCTCNDRIRPRTIKHEIGHAMGFWHTGSTEDLMSGRGVGGCDASPSARERYHAAIAYARLPGNLDVDVDAGGIRLQPLRTVVD